MFEKKFPEFLWPKFDFVLGIKNFRCIEVRFFKINTHWCSLLLVEWQGELEGVCIKWKSVDNICWMLVDFQLSLLFFFYVVALFNNVSHQHDLGHGIDFEFSGGCYRKGEWVLNENKTGCGRGLFWREMMRLCGLVRKAWMRIVSKGVTSDRYNVYWCLSLM